MKKMITLSLSLALIYANSLSARAEKTAAQEAREFIDYISAANTSHNDDPVERKERERIAEIMKGVSPEQLESLFEEVIETIKTPGNWIEERLNHDAAWKAREAAMTKNYEAVKGFVIRLHNYLAGL